MSSSAIVGASCRAARALCCVATIFHVNALRSMRVPGLAAPISSAQLSMALLRSEENCRVSSRAFRSRVERGFSGLFSEMSEQAGRSRAAPAMASARTTTVARACAGSESGLSVRSGTCLTCLSGFCQCAIAVPEKVREMPLLRHRAGAAGSCDRYGRGRRPGRLQRAVISELQIGGQVDRVTRQVVLRGKLAIPAQAQADILATHFRVVFERRPGRVDVGAERSEDC